MKLNEGQFCSRKCSNTFRNRSKENNSNWRGGKNKECLICKKEFWVKPSHKKVRKTCSKNCASILKIESKQFLGDKNPAWKHGKSNSGYTKFRRQSDLQFRIKSNLRSRLGIALRKNYKSGSAVNDLGCTIDEFKKYIESKFELNMTWENWGRAGWHLDHIKPLDSFNLQDINEFKIAVHYTNIQPLWAKENLSKGAK